jgi:hypothetical protein
MTKKKPPNDVVLALGVGKMGITMGRISSTARTRTPGASKRTRSETLQHSTYDRATGRDLHITQTVDKSDPTNKRYRKRIVDSVTGEVLRDDDEPLKEHTGRAPAKIRTK